MNIYIWKFIIWHKKQCFCSHVLQKKKSAVTKLFKQITNKEPNIGLFNYYLNDRALIEIKLFYIISAMWSFHTILCLWQLVLVIHWLPPLNKIEPSRVVLKKLHVSRLDGLFENNVSLNLNKLFFCTIGAGIMLFF
jgi:hypothetical protein